MDQIHNPLTFFQFISTPVSNISLFSLNPQSPARAVHSMARVYADVRIFQILGLEKQALTLRFASRLIRICLGPTGTMTVSTFNGEC